MEPKIVDLQHLTIAGVGGQFISNLLPNTNAHQVIPALWDQFISRRGELSIRNPQVTYGVISGSMDLNALDYVAGGEIAPDQPLPDGMQRVEVPAGRYAVFTHRGSVQTLPATTDHIYRQWLPESGLTMRDAPHLELYDDRFHPVSPDSELDILVPVR